MTQLTAQDLARGVINARRNSLLDVLGNSLEERKNCSAYIQRLTNASSRNLGRQPKLSKLVMAIMIDQVILCGWWLFLIGPPLMGLDDRGILARYWQGVGPFSLKTIAIAHLVYAGAACLAMQLFLFTAKFEGSTWQATPGKTLLGMRCCDGEGEPMSFKGSAVRLLGQHWLVLIATLTIVIPTSYALKQAFEDSTLKLLLPLVPVFAYFVLSFVQVDGKNIFQMISRLTVERDDKIARASMFRDILRICFFGDVKGAKNSRLDWFLSAMTMLSILWLLALVTTLIR